MNPYASNEAATAAAAAAAAAAASASVPPLSAEQQARGKTTIDSTPIRTHTHTRKADVGKERVAPFARLSLSGFLATPRRDTRGGASGASIYR